MNIKPEKCKDCEYFRETRAKCKAGVRRKTSPYAKGCNRGRVHLRNQFEIGHDLADKIGDPSLHERLDDCKAAVDVTSDAVNAIIDEFVGVANKAAGAMVFGGNAQDVLNVPVVALDFVRRVLDVPIQANDLNERCTVAAVKLAGCSAIVVAAKDFHDKMDTVAYVRLQELAAQKQAARGEK